MRLFLLPRLLVTIQEGKVINYNNAKDILPEALLNELQKYVSGAVIYVPAKDAERISWGSLCGTRDRYRKRNREIAQLYMQGAKVSQLAQMYYLSTDSIQKILRQENAKKAISC